MNCRFRPELLVGLAHGRRGIRAVSAPRAGAADHPGADGGRAGQRAGDRGLQRGRARLAAVRDARPPTAMRNELAAITGADRASPTTSISSATRRRRRARSARRPGARRWRRTIEELGIDPAAIASRRRHARRSSAERPTCSSEFKPPVVSFHFGLPSPELLARVRAWGAKILSSATTVDEARWLEARGVDAIIAQGARGRRPSRHVPLGRCDARRSGRSRCCRRSCAP